jgi:hypothetical protein
MKIQGIPADQIVGVVLPEKPVFDKVLALWLFVTFGLAKPVGEITREFWGGEPRSGNRPSEYRQRRWRQGHLYSIDVGKNKYQQRKLASAAEAVAVDIGLIAKWGLGDVFGATHAWITDQDERRRKYRANSGTIWYRNREADAHDIIDEVVTDVHERVALHFVLMASRNNGTGYLKGFAKSWPYLMRELEKGAVGTEAGKELVYPWVIDEIVELVLEVVDTHHRAEVEVLEGRATAFSLKDLRALPEVGELFAHEGAVGTDLRHFTLGAYLRDLLTLRNPAATVAEWAERVLVDVVGQAEEQRNLAAELYQLATKTYFFQGRGVVITSDNPAIADNPRLAREAFRTNEMLSVVVVQRASGQVAILSDGNVELRGVADALIKAEPELWFWEPRFAAVLNGGHSFSKVPPTRISLASIKAYIEMHCHVK